METNYIREIKHKLDNILKMKDCDGLLELYTLLVFTVGENCTNKHIHDAWSIWQDITEPHHKSLIPYEELSEDVQDLDSEYRDAVIKVAKLIK